MPNLKDRLQQDMNEALRAREAGRKRLSVIRLLRAAVLNAEKERPGGLDDSAVLAVLSREGKRLQGDIDEFRRLGQKERADELAGELEIVKEYLPQPLSAEEVEELARRAVAEAGATRPQEMGKVMKVLMPMLQGRADGRLASDIVKRLLVGGA
jgi:uncharacterized protein YqeY